MLRDLDYYQWVPRTFPIRIDDHIYYRRIDNNADSLTLYRFPIDELPRWTSEEKLESLNPTPSNKQKPTSHQQLEKLAFQVPNRPLDPELDNDLSFAEQEEAENLFREQWPEETVFSLGDLQVFYERFAA